MSLFPTDITRRFVAVYLFEAIDSTPNSGFDGLPKTDPDTGHGQVSGTSIKRKIRDTQIMTNEGEVHYVMPGGNLTDMRKSVKTSEELVARCRDLRTFGSALPGLKAVKGPVVFPDPRSIDPVVIDERPSSCCSFSTRQRPVKKDKSKDTDENGPTTEEFEGGNLFPRPTVRYGLYKGLIIYNAFDAKAVKMTSNDLECLWSAFLESWELTRSANRPRVNLRRVYVFTFPNARGNVHTHVIESWVQICSNGRPSCFGDYTVELDLSQMPDNMSCTSWVDGVVKVESK